MTTPHNRDVRGGRDEQGTNGGLKTQHVLCLGMFLQVLFIGLVLLTSKTPGSRDGTIAGKGRNRYPGSCLNPMLLRRQPWSLVDFLLTYG